ncbi:hypothetical protein [Tychonema sp. LEGE 06208]|uniref:hypothetical protein n=1 Tax=Tychonema sp. LEGE 06208 TaxID=1828663 RepID=UPI001882F697|nr:hypothetical protein [Tychonema sp. LEGE 06208]MBE9164998.1 hypothetical protein [Tychonema sp. LEGE 06208]
MENYLILNVCILKKSQVKTFAENHPSDSISVEYRRRDVGGTFECYLPGEKVLKVPFLNAKT